MRMRALATFTVGIALAGVSVYAVHQRLNQGAAPQLEAAEPPFVVGSVVVATMDLDYGDRLRADHLREAAWPADDRPAGSFETIEELLGDAQQPRVVLRAIAKGEPILPSRVSGFGARATLSTKLGDDKRAFSIRINDVSGVAGFLLPGDRVDVLLTRQLDNRKDRATDVILQNVVVLGIDQLADEDREKPRVARTATVEVTPEQAQKLALAQQVGSLSLALRNVGEAEEAKVRTVRIDDLVQSERRTRRGPARPSVRVRRGSEVQVEQLLGR